MPEGRSLIVGTDSASAHFTPIVTPDAIEWSAWEDTTAQGRVYFPIFVTSTRTDQITIDARPAIRTNYVTFEVSNDSDGRRVAAGSLPGVEQGTIVTLPLPAASAALLTVTVTAVGSGGRTQAATIRVALP
jgi:hypothetical protein